MKNSLEVAFRLALLGVTGCVSLPGCSGDAGGAQASAGGSGSAAGAGGKGGANALGAASGSESCPDPLATSPIQPGRLALPVRITVSDTALVIGEPATGPSGRQYKLSLFKFFLTRPVLVDASNRESQAELLGADGTVLPYGLQLVDADEPATQQLRLAAAPGSYTALRFGVGVPAACNSVSAARQVFPLNPDSDMAWTWGSQFMFIRIEGEARSGLEAAWGTLLYHVGYQPAFADVAVSGTLTVSAEGTGPALVLDIERLLAYPAPNLPPGKHTVPDGWIPDNLETNQVFSLQ